MNSFGVDIEIIEKALKSGIKVLKNNVFVNVSGFVSLVYIAQLDKFMFAYGSNQFDAGYVLLENYEKDWKLK